LIIIIEACLNCKTVGGRFGSFSGRAIAEPLQNNAAILLGTGFRALMKKRPNTGPAFWD
jgi:hypothetical protein